MPTPDPHRGTYALVAVSLLCAILGSVHAFSVFLEPMEVRFHAPRAQVSLTYSLALVSITLAVLLGHRTYVKLSAASFVRLVCVLAALGALVAAFAPTLFIVWLGYGVMFGVANGLGYGFGLQLAAQANPGREGWAMGLVTASYAFGATVAPPLLAWGLSSGGMHVAMIGLAAMLMAMAPVSVLLLRKANVEFRAPSDAQQREHVPTMTIVILWCAYGAAVAAGLMAIGHATGIVRQAGLAEGIWLAPMIIAICNLVGSAAGGTFVDRASPVRLLASLPILSAIALASIAGFSGATIALAALGVVGFAYGAIIAAYPAVISKAFIKSNSPQIYGKVFTSWGTAGLLAPWLAGALYDGTGSYASALILAAALSCVSIGCVFLLHRERVLEFG